jgi:hypothetical protein
VKGSEPFVIGRSAPSFEEGIVPFSTSMSAPTIDSDGFAEVPSKRRGTLLEIN